MARMVATAPELGALFDDDVADHVLAAFAGYRLNEPTVRSVGVAALAVRATNSDDARSAVSEIRTQVREALATSPEAIRVLSRDGEESWASVVLGWGAVQVASSNTGWYLVEAVEPSPEHSVAGLVAALPDRPSKIVERFSASGYESLAHHDGWTARWHSTEQTWKRVDRESSDEFVARVAAWLGGPQA